MIRKTAVDIPLSHLRKIGAHGPNRPLRRVIHALLLLLFLVVACRSDPAAGKSMSTLPALTRLIETPEQVLVAPEAMSPHVDEEKRLHVCLPGGLDSLLPVGDPADNGRLLAAALYEPLYTWDGYEAQPQGLVKLPRMSDGDARYSPVIVRAGDRVVKADGLVASLAPGVVVNIAGVRTVYEGGSLIMSQLSADFALQPMVWEDGRSVTSEDALFGFAVARKLAPDDWRVERTLAYEAVDAQTFRWTGLPGHVDHIFARYAWPPLPALVAQKHGFDAAVARLAERPLASGPFRLDGRDPEGRLHLIRNDAYYRAAEDLPHLEAISVRFFDGDDGVMNQNMPHIHLLDGACHLALGLHRDALEAPLPLVDAYRSGDIVGHDIRAGRLYLLHFNLDPTADSPRWFAERDVRQALALCLDRESIVANLPSVVGPPPGDVYLPIGHPFLPDDIVPRAFDPATGAARLERLGYQDHDGDGVRESPQDGAPFAVTLVVAQALLPVDAGALVKEMLGRCGVDVTLEWREPGEWAEMVRTRGFGMMLAEHSIDAVPNCRSFTSAALDPRSLPAGAVNYSGWRDEIFDAACDRAIASPLTGTGAHSAHAAAMRRFANEIPAVPLFVLGESYVAARHTVQNLGQAITGPIPRWALLDR